ncbi:amidohydrolase family protein [Hydrogenophaga sp. SL48]|uniref:amidohydrolase family protein n=1 Tax=Hydrogenophaga sp. SL48 TaxID=2806347 RepID=UPI001F2B50BD|nr:amidohydrolase family protein [Hydrogenophaga sp. SL48]UJW83131.1 amidohydrolase family protein [Hydrogenophaga sp. SL48]
MSEQTDTHVHVFDPWRFPYVSHRAYTPGAATGADLLRHLERIGCGRVVCVQPSVYGTNNACLLDALTMLNQAGAQARGSVVLDRSVTLGQLEAMHDAGVRAVRINWVVQESGRSNDPDALVLQLQTLNEQLGSLDWSIELFAHLKDILDIAPELARLKRKIVLDHFALLKPNDNPVDILSLARLLDFTPNVYLKLSAPYQVSAQTPDYSDLAPVVRTLVAAGPKQLLWGSNWPHTSGHARDVGHKPEDIEPFRYEDDAHTLALTQARIGSAQDWHRLMVTTPSQVFGF